MKKIVSSTLAIIFLMSSSSTAIASETTESSSYILQQDNMGITNITSWNEIPSKSDMPTDKIWTINFSHIFSENQIKGIFIERIKDGSFIYPKVNLLPIAKQAIVTPSEDYIRGESYNLKIILSNGKGYRMNFKIAEGIKRGNSIGNIGNGGLVAEDNGWIYYSNSNDSEKLYKVKSDGTENKKLSDRSAKYINVMEGWIYFYDNDNIYKVRTDGTSETRLYSGGKNMTLVGNYIYYSQNDFSDIYKGRIDGSNSVNIYNSSRIDSFNVVDEWIYGSGYSDDNKLIRMSTDGSNKITILKNNRAESINVIDNWIYFVDKDNRRIYKAHKSRGEVVRLNDTPSECLNVKDKYVYYINSSDRSIYRLSTDEGAKPQMISNFPAANINIALDWIFYNDPTTNVMYKMKIDGSQWSKVDF